MTEIHIEQWSDVVRLCELPGIESIGEFVDRFSMCESRLNSSQDLGNALRKVGAGMQSSCA